ncbi:MAG: DUF1161 domain-containing protein [Aquincola sp.]|nr:DUF1161 domain-containing protein [Aquincola sp.]MDH4288623.1 DUF1161 domain-containing protein [Aquincola sp.]MDH5328910.1 DUF1161 domain-containing protein [Aquincola sp.]
MPLVIRSAGALLLLMATAGSPANATPCEEVLASIEARIRANGVADFSVTAVDSAASAPGKQVGTCDTGRRKIMYVRGASSPSQSPASVPRPAAASQRPSGAKIITECADGRVIEGGTCKK